MKKRRLALALSILLSISLLVGCGNNTKENDKKENKASQKGSDVVNLMSFTELTTLDTSVMLDFPDAVTQTAAFEGLYALDKDDNVIPAVAKEMPEISEDGKTYTFKLRKDSVWSNGDKVTAKDFEYAWKKMIDPKNALVYSFLIQDTILNGSEIALGEKDPEELGVKSIDDYTLEVKLTEAKPYFTSLTVFPTFFPQNQKYVEKTGKEYGTSTDKTIYNGPFLVENWKQADLSWDLIKNDKYWDKKNVKSDKIHYEVIKDTSTAVNLYDTDQLDVASLHGVIASTNKEHEDFKSYPTGTINYIRLNQERDGKATPLANENLRKALALGINKENIIKKVVDDGSEPLNGLIPAGFVANPKTKQDFREEAGDLMTYNPKEAKKLWEKAKKELGDSVSIELLVNDEDNYKKIAESIQGDLQQQFKGLTISITSMPTEAALSRASESDYDMFLIYWASDYQDPISTLNTYRSGNKIHYSNPKTDELLNEAATTLSTKPEERWQALIAAEKEIIENTAGTIAISQNKETVLQKPGIKDLEYHTFASTVTLKNVYKE